MVSPRSPALPGGRAYGSPLSPESLPIPRAWPRGPGQEPSPKRARRAPEVSLGSIRRTLIFAASAFDVKTCRLRRRKKILANPRTETWPQRSDAVTKDP